ncbi:MAG: hypothetical protein L0Y54_23780, partial [Sporichthyaceae bacterium]|nr:hypothetical protein [Sporichthyaceae bacterium]
LRDGAMTWTAWFNPAANAAHDRLSDLPTSDQILTYCRGTLLGSPAAALVGKQVNYDPKRGEDGSLTMEVQTVGSGFGLEWLDQLTAGSDNLAGAGAGAGLDYGAATGTTAFGLQAWLHVLAFTGTSATVAVQHSNDNGGGDPYTDITGAVFAPASGIGAQRVETARGESVKRWLRVNVTGTFSNLDFAVAVAKNLTAVSF